MKAYKLDCLTEDGTIEDNGIYLSQEKAKEVKKEMDNWPQNKRYKIEQNITEIEINE